jgi:hypothetical protein
MKNGTKAGVRWSRVCRVGKEAGTGGVEVASIGTGQVEFYPTKKQVERWFFGGTVV